MENKRNQLKPGDTIRCIKTFWNSETQTQVKEGYIVRNMTQFGIDCLSHPECWEKVNSTREQAITWWDSIDPDLRVDFCIYYNDKLNLSGRLPSSLTGREIEEIWKNEVQVKELSNVHHNAEYLKPNQKQFVPNFSTKEEKLERVKEKFNQKQFKQFDESLHKAYLNKFSEEDKFKAFISNLNELTKEIQFNAFLATLKKMNLDSQTQSNIMALVALRDI